MYGMMKIIEKPEDLMGNDRCAYVIIKDEVTIRYVKQGETEYTNETLNFMGKDDFAGISYELDEVRARIGVPYEIADFKSDITWHDVRMNDKYYIVKNLSISYFQKSMKCTKKNTTFKFGVLLASLLV